MARAEKTKGDDPNLFLSSADPRVSILLVFLRNWHESRAGTSRDRDATPPYPERPNVVEHTRPNSTTTEKRVREINELATRSIADIQFMASATAEIATIVGHNSQTNEAVVQAVEALTKEIKDRRADNNNLVKAVKALTTAVGKGLALPCAPSSQQAKDNSLPPPAPEPVKTPEPVPWQQTVIDPSIPVAEYQKLLASGIPAYGCQFSSPAGSIRGILLPPLMMFHNEDGGIPPMSVGLLTPALVNHAVEILVATAAGPRVKFFPVPPYRWSRNLKLN